MTQARKIPGHAWANRIRSFRLGRPGGRTRRVFRITWTSVQNLAGGGTDRAAAMAYYAVQSVFPGLLLIVLVSLLLSSTEEVNQAVAWFVRNGLDPKLADSLNSTLQGAAERASGGVGIAALIAGLTSLSSASGWLAACGRAIEPDGDRRHSRGPIKGRIRYSLWTLVLIALLIVSLFALATGGNVADTVFGWFGADGAPMVWKIVRAPLVLAGIVGAMLLLYRVAPDRIHTPHWRDLIPGAIIAGLGWVVATGAFAFYVRNLATLGTTYGTFATPIVVLFWLWLSGVVVLFGAEVNAELDRRKYGRHWPVRLEGADNPTWAGHPAGAPPDPRDDDELLEHHEHQE
ncbi:MAG: YihY/virulence factor BrkB family protein [Patulibacter sp.]|nr:YihY/virulence factor BrkB family protein [Patulibacter sp.]